MLNSCYRQRGITLVELMIAGVIALIALSAALTVYSATARHSVQQLQRSHQHQQLSALLYLISNDLRRAGYHAFNPAANAPGHNPFQSADNRLRIRQLDDEAPASCVLLAYDLDRDGQVGIGRCGSSGCDTGTDDDNVEQFGFRLRDARLQSRYGGQRFDCASGNWQTLNDPNIEITGLRFLLHAQCTNLADSERDCAPEAPQLTQRAVEIHIEAQLLDKPDTAISASAWVRIRNDRLTEESL
ncbi:MAG TPA: hypothetical protein ENJ80_04400 [Gammaproteobacteria bacterium]|nr:hypothetical protein [Gammaproteobacteria bacterium]